MCKTFCTAFSVWRCLYCRWNPVQQFKMYLFFIISFFAENVKKKERIQMKTPVQTLTMKNLIPNCLTV